MLTIERRVKKRQIVDERPQDLTLEEVVEKLEGLRISPHKVINIEEGKYSNSVVRGFRISIPYNQDGNAKVRIIGTYFGTGKPEKIDYVHTFN